MDINLIQDIIEGAALNLIDNLSALPEEKQDPLYAAVRGIDIARVAASLTPQKEVIRAADGTEYEQYTSPELEVNGIRLSVYVNGSRAVDARAVYVFGSFEGTATRAAGYYALTGYWSSPGGQFDNGKYGQEPVRNYKDPRTHCGWCGEIDTEEEWYCERCGNS